MIGAGHLITLNISVLGFIGLVLLVLWRSDRRKTTALCWSLTLFVVALGWLLTLFRHNSLEQPIILAANAVFLLASTLTVIAVYLRSGHRIPWRSLTLLWTITQAALIWFVLVDNQVGIRILIFSASAAIHGVWASAHCLASRYARVQTDRLVGICLALASTLYVLRLLIVLASGNYGELDFYTPISGGILFVGIPSILVGCGMFVVLGVGLELITELRELAGRDPLTDTLNRRGFMERAEQEIARARRYNRPLSVISGDIDFFKKVNDLFGHAVGDRAIRTFADVMRTACRDGDIIGRLGGEEFVILLPETSPTQASVIASRIRELYAETSVQDLDGKHILTASFGVTALEDNDKNVDSLLGRADDALYTAKKNGRNRVTEANGETTPLPSTLVPA